MIFREQANSDISRENSARTSIYTPDYTLPHNTKAKMRKLELTLIISFRGILLDCYFVQVLLHSVEN